VVAVAVGGQLTAVFPGERAVWRGPASAEGMEAFLGVGLDPEELMNLLVGVPSPRLRNYEVHWGRSLPHRIKATLPDGSLFQATIESADAEKPVPAAAFVPPPADDLRTVEVGEARRLLGIR
jgi:hypothetical protein